MPSLLLAIMTSALSPRLGAALYPSAARPQPAARAGRLCAAEAAAPVRVEVCMNKYCKKRGSAATLELLQQLADGRDDVLVEVADMSHTEHGCFDECTMGPNVRIGGDGPRTDSAPFGAGKVVNGIKGEDAAQGLPDTALKE